MARLIRLAPRPLSSLPAHPALDAAGATDTPDLHEFALALLSEARSFVAETVPQTFVPDAKGTRASPPSAAKVELLTAVRTAAHASTSSGTSGGSSSNSHSRSRSIRRHASKSSASDVDSEFWVCRRSVHEDAARAGTASWAEFEHGLRENHSENEMAYTPSVSRVDRLVEWEVAGGGVLAERGWRDVEMHGIVCNSSLSDICILTRQST